MRPISLTICAFGSYGKKEVIDFTKPTQNLFLITGDTGAGKSTIFDAIVFALYGEASSNHNKKNGMELQSQFVDYGVEPYVELEFSENEKTYKVNRSPRHQRLLKNGKLAATVSAETVSLTMPDGTNYPTKETNNKLIEIVGLTKEQFMQVAMIAQGEFMQVLREKSDNKKAIFRKLFNTEIFEKIVNELRDRTSEKKSEMGKIRTACQTEVSHIEIPKGCSNEEILIKAKQRVLSEERLNSAVMEQLLIELDKLISEIEMSKDSIDRELMEADEKYIKLNSDYATANELKKRFEELEKAETDLLVYASKEDEIKHIGSLVSEIKIAYEIKTLYDVFETANKALVDEKETLDKLNINLPLLTSSYDKANEEYKKISKEKEISDEEFTKVSERVNKALVQLVKIEGLSDKLVKLESDKKKLEESAAKAKAELVKLEASETEWRKTEETLKQAEIKYAKIQNKKNNISVLYDEYTQIKSKIDDVDNQKLRVDKSQKEYIKAKNDFDGKNVEYGEKQSKFFDAQAGIIARKLVNGCACPVCGSTKHPNPCKVSDEAKDLTQDIIDALAVEVSKLRGVVENAAAKSKGLMDVLAEKEASCVNDISKLANKIKSMFGKDVYILNDLNSVNAKNCELALDEINTQIISDEKIVEESLAKLSEIRKNLATADERKVLLKTKSEEAESQASESVKNFTAVEAELKSLEMIKEYDSKNVAQEALRIATEKKKEIDAKHTMSEKEYQENKTAMESCSAKIKQCDERIPGLLKNAKAAKTNYESQMASQKRNEKWWNDIISEYDKDISVFESEVNEYNKNKASALAIKENGIKAIDGKKLPDMEELLEKISEAKEKKDAIAKKKSSLDVFYNANKTANESLHSRMVLRGKIMDEFDKLNEMYLIFSGNKTGSRMDIETFAQRYYLERILDAANRRFFDMSAGQFELKMCSLEKAGDGKNRGLDLMVYSNVTGREREIKTLSGGESFMAALALSLGMADVIQEKSSSINLDVMFIDEGFGSLDEHSRNEAVKVLKSMAGGTKLIGIISHVSELKQEIDDLLLVKKDEKGSRTEWINS